MFASKVGAWHGVAIFNRLYPTTLEVQRTFPAGDMPQVGDWKSPLLGLPFADSFSMARGISYCGAIMSPEGAYVYSPATVLLSKRDLGIFEGGV